jgi:hypothetical protein
MCWFGFGGMVRTVVMFRIQSMMGFISQSSSSMLAYIMMSGALFANVLEVIG